MLSASARRVKLVVPTEAEAAPAAGRPPLVPYFANELLALLVDGPSLRGGLGLAAGSNAAAVCAAQGAPAANVFALAVTLWELWYRAPPFAHLGPAKVARHVLKGHRLPLDAAFGAGGGAGGDAVGCEPPPRLLAELIAKCWAPVPSARPTVATAFHFFKASVAAALTAAPTAAGGAAAGADAATANPLAFAGLSAGGAAGASHPRGLSAGALEALAEAGLEAHGVALAARGFNDLALMTEDLLDDDLLANEIGGRTLEPCPPLTRTNTHRLSAHSTH